MYCTNINNVLHNYKVKMFSCYNFITISQGTCSFVTEKLIFLPGKNEIECNIIYWS